MKGKESATHQFSCMQAKDTHPDIRRRRDVICQSMIRLWLMGARYLKIIARKSSSILHLLLAESQRGGRMGENIKLVTFLLEHCCRSLLLVAIVASHL